MNNLLPAVVRLGIHVDLLKIGGHGPYIQDTPNGFRIVPLNCRHVSTALPSLVRYLRNEQPVALLSDKDRVNRTAILARWLARSNSRHYVRIGTTVSANLANRTKLERWKQTQSIRYLYSHSDGILVPSKGVADDLHRLMRSNHPPIKVVPSPVVRGDLIALSTASPIDPWLDKISPPLILAAGELSARKDHATLIRAFSVARAERPMKLAIIGEGRERTRLQALAHELGISSDVYLPGFVTNPYPWIARADVFAHSSRWEGLAVVLVEALALGTPVVATDCPSGTRELLDDGRLGRLVPVGDANAMARAILDTLITPIDRQSLQYATQPYHVMRSARAYLHAMGLTPNV
nr:glycosyltransferase [Thioalkalivibrio sulfidiphilus]